MDYSKKLKYHYRPKKGWINDPNGLVYFQGYYHVFYQHSPDFERPWNQPMHWGHARTKDFLIWEELPVALYPDKSYDNNGCWSGTAIVKDDTLYLIYSSIFTPEGKNEKNQRVSVAYSTDGINFTKYENNPVISEIPYDVSDGNFRDPAVCFIDGNFYCVMAVGCNKDKTARLLLYESTDLLNWKYNGVMKEWGNCVYAECPSINKAKEMYLLSASVCYLDYSHFFTTMFGDFVDGKFTTKYSAEIDKGPDQYAGQIFQDHLGRNILISWAPGWAYDGYYTNDVGCMSTPREIKCIDGKITAYPVKELQHLLKDEDECLKRTETGFIVERTNRAPLVYTGQINNLKILRDEYLVEIFINEGEEVYTVLL